MPQCKNEELVRRVRLADFVRVRRGGRADHYTSEVPTEVDGGLLRCRVPFLTACSPLRWGSAPYSRMAIVAVGGRRGGTRGYVRLAT